jgi:Restriction endonuclease
MHVGLASLSVRSEPLEETWLDLEKLAALIYAEIEPGSTVTHNATLRGRLSESDRQIDVLIENEDNQTRVVVDCKDWARRVSVVDVGAFASLVEDVEATGGVLTCNKGFSKPARRLAASKGISLCQLHDVASRKWQLDVLIPIIWTQVQLVDLGVGFRGRMAAGDSLSTIEPPECRINGRTVDPLQLFAEGWNPGDFVLRKPGHWTAEVPAEIVTLEGNTRYVLVDVNAQVATRARLGVRHAAEIARHLRSRDGGVQNGATGRELDASPACRVRKLDPAAKRPSFAAAWILITRQRVPHQLEPCWIGVSPASRALDRRHA